MKLHLANVLPCRPDRSRFFFPVCKSHMSCTLWIPFQGDRQGKPGRTSLKDTSLARRLNQSKAGAIAGTAGSSVYLLYENSVCIAKSSENLLACIFVCGNGETGQSNHGFLVA